MVDWEKGYSARYYACIVDTDSWHDESTLEITGGTISRSNEGLRCSADIDCTNYSEDKEQWIRIWMEAKQGNNSSREALFTGLVSCPDQNINGSLRTNSLQCYSVLKPLQDIILPRGWYIPAKASSVSIIKDLMRRTPAPLIVSSSQDPKIQDYIIAEDGESYLSMLDKILVAIGWRLRIQGDGTVELCPPAEESVATLHPTENDIVEPELKIKNDWYACPNVFRAVSDESFYEVRDTNEDNLFSIPNRRREVWAEETSCDLNDGETIVDYARRRLKELQKTAYIVSYYRRFDPNILVTDNIDLFYAAQGVQGTFNISSQSIELGYGARTSEEVVKL